MRRGFSRALAGCVAALGLASSGCMTTPPTVGDPAPKVADAQAEAAYQDTLKRYSGTAQIYGGLDTHLFSGATFQTWPFREARVRRLALFKAMTQTEVEALLAKERAEWEQFHVFEFGAWTQDPKFDDFDRDNSIWRMAMVTEGVEVLPTDVERVARVDQNVRAIYPYMGQFWVAYRMKFPKTRPDGQPVIPAGTDRVLLRVSSTLGQAEMWSAAE